MGKIKKFTKKHGKKIGRAALTAAKKTALTFNPLKKVKAAYKVGKAGVKLVKKADTAFKKKVPNKKMLKYGIGAGLGGTAAWAIAHTPTRKELIKDLKKGHAANLKAARELKRDLKKKFKKKK
tara:strand:- start:30 stop:398 length:369 start_codon:yes stop_codon:yes gene_type:complete